MIVADIVVGCVHKGRIKRLVKTVCTTFVLSDREKKNNRKMQLVVEVCKLWKKEIYCFI